MSVITAHDQKMAMLTEKPNSSQTYPHSVQMPDQLLQEQMEAQIFSPQSQMSDVKSALVVLRSELLENQKAHKAKVITLEEALAQAHIQTEKARRERDLFLHQTKQKDFEICQIAAGLCEIAQEMKHQLLEKDTDQNLTIQRMQQELEQLRHDKQQLESLVWSLKEEWQNSQMLADADQQEGQTELKGFCEQAEQTGNQAVRSYDQSHGKAESQGGVQELLSKVELMQQNLENMERSSEFQRGAHGTLQESGSSLVQQLVSFKLDNQLLQTALKEAELRLSAVEKEKTELQKALSEANHSLQKLTHEKQRVTAQLDMQHVMLAQLQEEQGTFNEQHSRRTEELKTQNDNLQSLLNKTQRELHQALRALEGAKGHGLQAAQDMQQELTAKREQVDFLRSRMQMLEDVMEKFAEEKGHRAMEMKSQEQELLFERESRRTLEMELENVCTSEKQLKNKVRSLDAALYKMSDSFAECQEFIQKQEQEIVQLKLQHALEVKELQGQNLWSTAKVYKPDSATLPAKPPLTQANSTSLPKIVDPALKLENPVKELHGVTEKKETIIYTNLSPKPSDDNHRTRKHETANGASNGRVVISICYSEQGSLRTTHLHKRDVNVAFSPNYEEMGSRQGQSFSTSPCVAALGRKSPVHCLLTSDHCTDVHRLEAETSESIIESFDSKQNELAGSVCKDLQSRLESLQNRVENLQLKNEEMVSIIKHQERKIRRVQIRREPQKR